MTLTSPQERKTQRRTTRRKSLKSHRVTRDLVSFIRKWHHLVIDCIKNSIN